MGEFTRVSTCFKVNLMILQMDPWGGSQRCPRTASSAWLVLGGRFPASILLTTKGLGLSVFTRAMDARPCKKKKKKIQRP